LSYSLPSILTLSDLELIAFMIPIRTVSSVRSDAREDRYRFLEEEPQTSPMAHVPSRTLDLQDAPILPGCDCKVAEDVQGGISVPSLLSLVSRRLPLTSACGLVCILRQRRSRSSSRSCSLSSHSRSICRTLKITSSSDGETSRSS
jgi:hypothetical protein